MIAHFFMPCNQHFSFFIAIISYVKMLTLSYYPVLKIGIQRVSAKSKSCKVILTRSILYEQQLKCLRLVYFQTQIFFRFLVNTNLI